MSSIGLQHAPVLNKFSLETLRFICNAQQGTTIHYLAVRELKRRQWRFHTGMGVWVRRDSDARVSETSESGVMILADPNNFTQQKLEFTFPYAYLETDVMPHTHRE
jgi:CCR4-NOT transcription complex subunit 2